MKSGYKYWHTQKIGVDGVTQSLGWGKIWRLNIPHKLKIFLWRFCRNTIPVRNRLRHKGIVVPILCSMCGIDVEHMAHIFFDCEFSKHCWSSVGIEVDIEGLEFASDWLLEKLSTEPQDRLILIVTVLWSIWFARNKKVWEGVSLAPKVAVELSSKHVTEWRQVWKKKNSKERAANSGVQSRVRWRPPEPGCLKINVDASIRENEDHYSIGMVMRDHEGRFLMDKTLKVEGKISVLEAESVGVLEALLWTKHSRII